MTAELTGYPRSAPKTELSVTRDQHVHTIRPDYGRHALAAATHATATEVQAVAEWLRADDFATDTDASLWRIIAALASEGTDPTAVLVQARAETAGVPGWRAQRRLIDIATSTACGSALAEYGQAVMADSYRRAARAVAEGITDAADNLPTADILPYCVTGWRRLRSIADRLPTTEKGADQ